MPDDGQLLQVSLSSWGETQIRVFETHFGGRVLEMVLGLPCIFTWWDVDLPWSQHCIGGVYFPVHPNLLFCLWHIMIMQEKRTHGQHIPYSILNRDVCIWSMQEITNPHHNTLDLFHHKRWQGHPSHYGALCWWLDIGISLTINDVMRWDGSVGFHGWNHIPSWRWRKIWLKKRRANQLMTTKCEDNAPHQSYHFIYIYF